MSLHAFNAGCNIMAFVKNGKRYGMCCAWAMMLDNDRLGMLLGAQSATGKALAKGDVVGVCALTEGQEEIARRLGDGHSDRVDKFAEIKHHLAGTAILIDAARTTMVCEVADVMRLEGIEADRFVILTVMSFEQDEKKAFLNAYVE